MNDPAPAPPLFPSPEVSPLWLFGYGSLIWRPDFTFVEQCRAVVSGHVRRFWQGSHDHRGVPGAPGRVVTLVPEPGACCEGMAWRVAGDRAGETLARLDHREQDGYTRVRLVLTFGDGRTVEGLTWIAAPGNPSWLGPAPLVELTEHIARSSGPSGSNANYVHALAAGLDALDIVDPHVRELSAALRSAS